MNKNHYIAYKEDGYFFIGNYYNVGLLNKNEVEKYLYSFEFNNNIESLYKHDIYQYLENLISLNYIIDNDSILISEEEDDSGGRSIKKVDTFLLRKEMAKEEQQGQSQNTSTDKFIKKQVLK